MLSRHVSEPEIALSEPIAPATSDRAVVSQRAQPRGSDEGDKFAALRLELSEARTRLLQERLLHSVQRASAEQAYRVSETATRFVGTLLDTLAQPAFQFTRETTMVRWNAALSKLTGISAEVAIGRDLRELFTLDHTRILTDLLDGFLSGEQKEPTSGVLPGDTPLHFALIPQFRIPDCLETVVVLISQDAL